MRVRIAQNNERSLFIVQFSFLSLFIQIRNRIPAASGGRPRVKHMSVGSRGGTFPREKHAP